MNTKEKIEAAWRKRAESAGLNPKHAAYKKAEVEFFVGAMAALEAADTSPRPENEMSKTVPPIWIINIATGRPVVEVKK